MAKKLTIAEQFEGLLTKYADVFTDKEKAFLADRKEKAVKKNADRKPTKTQTENADIKVAILDFMESGKTYTITDIQKGVGIVTNQKTSALVRQLKEDGLVVRSVDKGKAYFAKA